MNNVPLAADTLRLIDHARQESIRMRHEYIGTEHILLALTRDDVDRVPSPLAELGVDVARANQLVEQTIRGGRDPLRKDLDRPFTSRTKQVFVFAEEAARELGQSHVDVGHVVYGIMREQRGIAAQVLHDQGLTAELVEDKIRRGANRGDA
jgi:ATP-dependent Clp protease ATP-binding subunit ClpC